ncbi:MAG: InlB B-repeat-containing protein, partial [Clostridia bacterium]|nr:InlB B-repeat-containing protein [Clostridia bacterium]
MIYDLNGGVGGPASLVEYHRTGDSVTTATAPAKDGFEFLGWLAEDGTLYAAGAVLSDAINAPYRLTAQWKKINKATVNVTVIVDGKSADGTVDKNLDREMTIELTYRPFGSSEDYVEFVGHTFTDKDGYYIGTTVGNVTTTDYIGLFKDLDVAYEYAANAFMSEYEVIPGGRTVTSTTDANGDITYHVTIRMQYAPEMRMLEYTVVEDIENDDLVPEAIDVKIYSFYNPYLYGVDVPNKKAWHPLVQHMNSTHDAFFDTKDANDNWCGHESYIVWTWEDQEENLSYHYRVAAAGLTLKDGTELTMVSTDGIHYISLASADGRYPAGAYTAVVSVEGGASPDGNALTGAYFDKNSPDQIGSIVITVKAHPYTVTFVPNGGTLLGTTDNTVLVDQFVVPNVDAYVPVRNDAYVFDRWVLVDANGNPTNQSVTAGQELTADITLVALWKAPKTVEGLVTVGATYEQTNEDGRVTIQTIHESDRPQTAVVLLQRIAPNGYFETISSFTVTLDYTNQDYYYLGSRAVGMGYYEFTNIPDDGSEYRVQLLLPNFTAMFQNEPKSVKKPLDYPIYNETDYAVLWGTTAPEVGTVNIHNHFLPDCFDLEYEVDASAIGNGFRPDSVELLVTYDNGKGVMSPADWAVISQMIFSDGMRGDDVALTNGLGSGSYPVWISSKDGVTYYIRGLREVNGVRYERYGIKTHFIERGEDYIEVLQRYVSPLYQAGDVV